jgi:hypothetical protein
MVPMLDPRGTDPARTEPVNPRREVLLVDADTYGSAVAHAIIGSHHG